MEPEALENEDRDCHAWRAAKIYGLGTRMGGPRGIYDKIAQHVGSKLPYHESLFLGNHDPEDIRELLLITTLFMCLMEARTVARQSLAAIQTWEQLIEKGIVGLYIDIVASKGFLGEHAVSLLWYHRVPFLTDSIS